MTPAALSTYKDLRALGLPIEIQRKVSIAADGKPSFAALTDGEFDALMRAVRRMYGTAGDTPQFEGVPFGV